MIERYAKTAMSRLFTVKEQWATALQVEVAAVVARAQLGQITDEDRDAVLRGVPQEITDEIVAQISEREAKIDHDVAAFVDVMQSYIDHDASRWFHYGLTSADITDTALCLRLTEAADLLIGEAYELLSALCVRAREFADVPTAGRTHGQHAEVITFGVRLANWAFMVERSIDTLVQARDEIAVGKLSGACGTYSNIDPEVENIVCGELGLRPITATQVVPRDLHANLVYACVRLGGAIGHISFNLRIMASTEYGEVEEGRRPEQKGSSAMPHKRNPIKGEQLDGLARVLRGNLVSSLEEVELLFERDISHSAPERIVLADTLILCHYMTVTMVTVLSRLVVKPARMQLNIDRGLGLMYTQTVLTSLIDQGMLRDDAYRLVQSLAYQAIEENRPFRELLNESTEVMLTSDELDTIFDQSRLLAHVGDIIDRLPA